LGLGSNLGDKAGNLNQALAALRRLGRLARVSSFYRTEPVGFREQDWFLNAAALVLTGFEPLEFLAGLQTIEAELGRVRVMPNGPRTMDLDILFWGSQIIAQPDLVIPHPRLHERRFVLAPLAEIAPTLAHPVLGQTIRELLSTLQSPEQVELWE
jgi:2-amino-4-hydroxy-6-hydroxymethyldihydropteridine diphosphokinase